jgi:hypothetical protein
MKKSDIEAAVKEMEQKYFDLVWLARKRPEDRPKASEAIDRIRKAYPDEVERLRGEHGDWEHGFNSGCLAAFRYVFGLFGTDADAAQAKEEFPFLDT